MLAAHKSTLSTHALSTILLASVVVCSGATAKPAWTPPKFEPRQSNFSEPTKTMAAETNMPIVKPIGDVAFLSPKNRAIRTLQSYHPENPLGDISINTNPDHIEIAQSIIQALPSGFPIPWVNRNDDGEVGLYWDDDNAYADIDIDGEGGISFYSKLRSTGDENFVDEIALEEFDQRWISDHLSLLLKKSAETIA